MDPNRAGRQVRPLADWLREHRKGALSVEVAEALNELVEAVQEVGKPGKLVVTLTIKPATPNKSTSEMVTVTDEVKLTLPEHDRETALYFIDDNFNLSRRHPNQEELPGLRAVDPDTGEVTRGAEVTT